jgi:RNA polymerase sigma-70 factor (ECF subfamily)
MLEAWRQVNRRPWDDADFERTFQAHYEGVYRLLYRFVGAPEEAADLAQETFLRLYRQRFSGWREHNVRAWLYRVATNLAYNALRGRQRGQRRQQRVQRLVEPRGQEQDPAEAAVRNEEREDVRRVLAAMPARQARLLLLYYAGLSYREVAEALGVAPASVGTLLARAKAVFERRYRGLHGARGGKSDEV